MNYTEHDIMSHLLRELDKKADKGINSTADLDVVVKLTEAMKNMAKADYYCTVTEAMHDGSGGYSERRHRDSMGRYAKDGGPHHGYDDGSSYSAAKNRYMEDKHSYRSTHSPEHKRNMNSSLDECMDRLKAELDEMEADADTREEREKIREMRRSIGKLA